MLEGRLFMQCQFTFSRGKKDYHLLSSNVERRPPSHSSAGLWKQWGKLNSHIAHSVWCMQVGDEISKANTTSNTLAAAAPAECSESQISTP